MSGLWVVVPTYEEADNLVALVTAVRAADVGPNVRLSLLIVDDGSPDGTGGLADALALALPDVHVVHRPRKAGLGGAYRAGFAAALTAGADVVVQMDADLSHDPADLPRLLAALNDGADVAIGSRYVPGGATAGWSPRRRLLSQAGGVYARAVLGSRIRDLTGGFKAFRADALRAIELDALTADGYAFQIEVNHRAERAGLTVAEIPIAFREREHGRSKMSAAIAVEALWRIPALRLRHRRRRAVRPRVARA